MATSEPRGKPVHKVLGHAHSAVLGQVVHIGFVRRHQGRFSMKLRQRQIGHTVAQHYDIFHEDTSLFKIFKGGYDALHFGGIHQIGEPLRLGFKLYKLLRGFRSAMIESRRIISNSSAPPSLPRAVSTLLGNLKGLAVEAITVGVLSPVLAR